MNGHNDMRLEKIEYPQKSFSLLLYGMYSHVRTATELRQIVISNPFDSSEEPRQMKLTDLADWLEAIVSS
jgi:hypothetical protein